MRISSPLNFIKICKETRRSGLGRRETFRNALRFWHDVKLFLKQNGKIDRYWPIINEFQANAGTANGHYFHQDLLVAQYIYERNSQRHLDIGSRIDGFVAHVASFREIHVMDIRPLGNCGHNNINFIQADLMQPQSSLTGKYDSVSCLHALEHFGLGRYGDIVDPNGHKKGFSAIANIVAEGGILYISFPIGKPQVIFNAHRIFSPNSILDWAGDRFFLEAFDFIDDHGDLIRNAQPEDAMHLDHGCGIFSLRKTRQ
jgi:hypothetical protein